MIPPANSGVPETSNSFMKPYSSTFFSLLLFASACSLGGGESGDKDRDLPLYVATRLESERPMIDGDLDDAVWKHCVRAPIARQHHDEEPVLGDSRKVGYWMATWDAENLYIAADVLDKDVNGRQSNAYEPHNDVVELFFDPLLNYQYNLQYRVWPFGFEGGPKGCVTQDPTWGRWEVASTETDSGYRTEIRIPLFQFMEVAQVSLGEGDLIGFDLSIHDAPFPTGEQWLPPKITGWSGDGTNWQYASENGLLALGEPNPSALRAVRPEVEDIGETPVKQAMALWPRNGLIEGFFNLDVPRQSWSWKDYEPWRLGRVRHVLLDTSSASDVRTVNRTVGPHAHGEALEPRPRVVELALSGERDGRQEDLTVISTPFHPAMSYRTSAETIGFFDEMVKLGQPSGSTYVALPLQEGVEIREVRPGTLYEAERDGLLSAGWVLVWFARDGDGRDTDFPSVLYPNRAPRAIEVTEGGGIVLRFDHTQRNAVDLLPLYGIQALERRVTDGWREDGALPAEVVARIELWQGRSLRLPVGVRELWQYDPEGKTFSVTHRFSYSENLSTWGVPERLLAPLPLLLSSERAFERFPETPLKDLDYDLFQGSFYAVEGAAEVTVKLAEVDLDALPPMLDPEILRRSELGTRYLEALKKLDLAGIFQTNMDQVMARAHFMPHIWPLIDKPDLFAGLPTLEEAALEAVEERVDAGYEDIIFNEAWRERLWSDASPYLGSDFRYGKLTYPYGVAEPYYGYVEMLSKMNYYCAAMGDYSEMARYWPKLKHLAEIIWYGGFVQYRYDGGTMIGEALIGLIRGAEASGDLKFQRRAMLRLAQHAASAPGHLEGGRRLAKNRSWAIRGMSPVLLGDVQQTTPSTASAIADGTLSGSDGMLYWDRGYGNPVVLREFALPEVEAIENKIDTEIPDWYEETEHNFKRRDGMFRRFTVRALVTRDPIDELLTQVDGLRETFKDFPPFEAAIVIIFLQRLQEDLVKEGNGLQRDF